MNLPRLFLALLFGFLVLLPAARAAGTPTPSTEPSIASVRGHTVTVTVPAGFDSVTLQSIRVHRVGRAAPIRVWSTVDTKFPAAAATTLSFRVTRLTPKRNLRVFGSRSGTLPASFTTGVTSFGADTLTLATNNGSSGPRLAGDVTTMNVTSGVTSGSNVSSPAAPVVESDIWKIAGDRLYFFNQLRGLESIDVSNPDDPALLGTLRMPASGEDLYLVDDTHVALLKRGQDFWWGGPIMALDDVSPANAGITLATTASSLAPTTTLRPYAQADRSNELIIADVSAGAPQQVASVPFKGALNESRFVGHVLYVATSTSRDTTGGGSEYGTEVTAFDLSDPANPVQRDSVFITGWAATVTATSDYFIVTGGWPNTLQLVDISAGDGTLKLAGTVAPEGYVADKFKLDVENGVLTVLSQVWLPWTVDETGTWTGGGTHTVLQTFSLADPAAPTQLGRLVLAPGESLRATRFDAGRVYVVTFEQIDPLHIVDLSDPANPVIAGSVQAPGFSTYIQPLGDRLVTIGLVNWKPAISLFDVSDPAAPALLQQLVLGGKKDGWSSSEAVWNEKAFKVLPDQNLILLPVSGFDLTDTDQWGGEWFSRVQIVDLFHDSLAQRGVIDRSFSPRRADVVNDRIVAISPAKLVSVNADNRDTPKVTAELELAWSVQRVFQIGDYVVEIGSPADWTGNPAPALTVAPAADPDASLTVADLDPLDVVGSDLRDGVLYLAQRAWPRWWVNDAAASKPQLLVTTYDVSALPKLKKLSQASGPAPVDSWGQLTPLWPSPGTLVWVANGRYLSWQTPIFKGGGGVIALSANATRLDTANLNFRPWWGGYTKEFIAFDVSAPEKIVYASSLEVKPVGASLASEPVAAAGLIYFSEQQLWDNNAADGTNGDAGKHFLRVVEYSEPTLPFLRDERVNIPGRLAAVAREGKLLYTVGCDVDPATGETKASAALHASAFDGTAAHLIATQLLPSISTPVLVSGANVIYLDEQPAYVWQPYDPGTVDPSVGVSISMLRPIWWGNQTANPKKSSIHIDTLTDAGAFTELGSLELAHDSGLHLFGDLAVTQPDYNSIRALDLSNTLVPTDLGAFSFSGNVWPQLDGAAGALGVGLWLPVGAYGVETIGLGK